MIHSCKLAGNTRSKFAELDETHKLVDRLLSVAQRLKSNVDLLRSTDSVPWNAIWHFLQFNDALNLQDIEAKITLETDKFKAQYAELLMEQDRC